LPYFHTWFSLCSQYIWLQSYTWYLIYSHIWLNPPMGRFFSTFFWIIATWATNKNAWKKKTLAGVNRHPHRCLDLFEWDLLLIAIINPQKNVTIWSQRDPELVVVWQGVNLFVWILGLLNHGWYQLWCWFTQGGVCYVGIWVKMLTIVGYVTIFTKLSL